MTPKALLNIKENVPLAPLTTLKVGGPARFFAAAVTEEQVSEALRFASAQSVSVFVLGGGSNILVSDKGFDGLVLQPALRGIEIGEAGSDDRVRIRTGAGEDWDKFVAFCVDRDLAGTECLSGIPGNVGGTPVQNVGAYGQEVAETIESVRCLDRSSGRVQELSNEECGFAYRKSIFNSTHRDRYVVLSVTFALAPGGRPKIVYQDLKEFFNARKPSLAEARAAVLRIRAEKSMVLDPFDPNSQSAGSFFKNPIIRRSELGRIEDAADSEGNVPYFEAGADMIKVPAAWLIERAGFHKGFTMGNAGISSRHSLALINRGRASAAEIVALKDRIVDTVRSKFGIELVPEPVFVGF